MHPDLETMDRKIADQKVAIATLKKRRRTLARAKRGGKAGAVTNSVTAEIAGAELALKTIRTARARLAKRLAARGDVMERVTVKTPIFDPFGVEVDTLLTQVVRRKPVALRSLPASQESAVELYRDLIDRVAGSSAMRALAPRVGRGSGGVSDGGATSRVADAEALRDVRAALRVGEIALQGRVQGARLGSLDLFDSVVLRGMPIDEILKAHQWPESGANRGACMSGFAWLVARCACKLGCERGTDRVMPPSVVIDRARDEEPAKKNPAGAGS